MIRLAHRRVALALACLAVATAGAGLKAQDAVVAPFGISDIELAKSDYVENCAGCHGNQGSSAPAKLPELRGRVGYFMCTPAARAYLIRLPNVAHSRITDNQQLADLMNFVVFVIGGASAPAGTQPFTAAEVAHERGFALTSVSLTGARAHYADEAVRKCHAPASLRLFYPGEKMR